VGGPALVVVQVVHPVQWDVKFGEEVFGVFWCLVPENKDPGGGRLFTGVDWLRLIWCVTSKQRDPPMQAGVSHMMRGMRYVQAATALYMCRCQQSDSMSQL
jgi:hypothetical protein